MRDNMDDLKGKNSLDYVPPVRSQGVPGAANKHHNEKIVEDWKKTSGSNGGRKNDGEEEQLSLNDDRRVKVLSPGALVAKRFFRNRLAVVGLIILAVMFVFSFIGGVISPYGQDEVFYRHELQAKEYAAVTENTDFRFVTAEGQDFSGRLQAQFMLAAAKNETSFTYKDATYDLAKEGEDFYVISQGNTPIALASKDLVNAEDASLDLSFEFQRAALTAYTNGVQSFTANGNEFTVDEHGGVNEAGQPVAYISRFVVESKVSGVTFTRDFKEQLAQVIENGGTEFSFTNNEGTYDYTLVYDADTKSYSVKQEKETQVFDTYSTPSKAHWLGTDRNGMDMLTRLMYGGRVSLVIGFIVVFISAFLGIILGGVAGYFGKWVDNLIMRIVDVFYCIPSMPLIIIMGSAMDGMRVDPQMRMLYLMLVLGFLGWPSIARMVRGQILSLREQEFMTATEACGISIPRRIFRHLIPNVIPQLIVICTMSLGSTIITEATLSFLGLGVKFPFASWGNIINDVSNSYVLTSYWFVWIPAGICLLLTVLGFNFVGDGLRDAFDPKMKR